MQKVVIKTATEARREFFDLLAAAKYGGQITAVSKNGKRMARIVTDVEEKKIDWKEYRKVLASVRGMFTDEDVRAIEKVRKDSKISRFPDW